MPTNRTIKIVAGVAASFIGLVGVIILLSRMQIISFAAAKLMLVALLALYVGVGILVAIHRFIGKLD